MTSKKLLLADANFSCIPILMSLKHHEWELSACGNLAKDPCHRLADNSLHIDYSNAEELTLNIKRNGYDFLVPGCNDVSYISCASAAEEIGLPGYDPLDTVLTLHHKNKFRDFSENKKYPVPKATPNVNEAKFLALPVIVKPTDAFSGRGVSKLTDLDNVKEKYSEAIRFSKSSQAIIEEFISGTLHSHSAFIKNGRILIDFFVDEYCTVYEYQVNSSCISYSMPQHVKQKVRDWCETLAQDLSLVDGLVHTQFILRNDDFWLIEVTRRCPGDLYSELITKSTGINYAALYAASFTEKGLPDNVPKQTNKYVARHTASSNRECVLHSTGILPPAVNSKIEFTSIASAGDIIREAPFGKTGIFFIEFDSQSELLELTPSLYNFVRINSFEALKP